MRLLVLSMKNILTVKFYNAYQLIKRIPNALVILFLILLTGLAEGVGISALVPVLSSLTGEFSEGQLPAPFNFLPDAMLMIGITPSFGVMLLFTLAVMLLSYLMVHLQERALFAARFKYLQQIRERANKAVFSSYWEYLAKQTSGSISNVIIHESDRGAEGLLALMMMLAIAVQLLVYGIFALMLSWQMFLIAFFTLVITFFTSKRLINRVRSIGKESVDANNLYSRQFVEFVRGAKLLKATGIAKNAMKSLEGSNSNSCNASRKITISSSVMKFEIQMIISIAMVGILYLAVEVIDVPVSVLLVFMFIVMRLAPKVSSLQGQYHSYTSHRPSLDIFDKMILDAESAAEIPPENEQYFNGIKNEISFERVSYRYPNEENDALNNISLVVKAHDFVALVGKSGSGKSTALDLLMGLTQPSKGRVLIDGIDLQEINKNSFRSKIGFVSQDSIFFVGSIRENICFGLDDKINESFIWDCLKTAQIDSYVKNLQEGLGTQVGESGVKLSGGQRQRLSIARALIRKPELLILDEATSALDSESELQFQKAIQAVAKNYTIVVVAHRLSTIRKASKIYVLEDGCVIQEGSYSTLKDQPGMFSTLVSAQALGD